jgi:hypothetical protein
VDKLKIGILLIKSLKGLPHLASNLQSVVPKHRKHEPVPTIPIDGNEEKKRRDGKGKGSLAEYSRRIKSSPMQGGQRWHTNYL